MIVGGILLLLLFLFFIYLSFAFVPLGFAALLAKNYS